MHSLDARYSRLLRHVVPTRSAPILEYHVRTAHIVVSPILTVVVKQFWRKYG